MQYLLLAPRAAQPLIQALLGATTAQTRDTVKLFGLDKAEWSEYLHTIIPENQLTSQFGGTKRI